MRTLDPVAFPPGVSAPHQYWSVVTLPLAMVTLTTSSGPYHPGAKLNLVFCDLSRDQPILASLGRPMPVLPPGAAPSLLTHLLVSCLFISPSHKGRGSWGEEEVSIPSPGPCLPPSLLGIPRNPAGCPESLTTRMAHGAQREEGKTEGGGRESRGEGR